MKNYPGTSLGVQWLRVCLPMQGTWVQSLVREDPTCYGGNQALTPEVPKPVSPRAWCSGDEKPLQREACRPLLESRPRLLQLEEACTLSSDRAPPTKQLSRFRRQWCPRQEAVMELFRAPSRGGCCQVNFLPTELGTLIRK